MKIVDLGKGIVQVSQFTGRQLIVAGCVDLICVGKQTVIILSRHVYVYIIVPGNKALMTDSAEKSPPCKIIPDPVPFADVCKDLKDPELSLLNLTEVQFLHFASIIIHLLHHSISHIL